MGLKYSKETVAFQRKKINEILKGSYKFKKLVENLFSRTEKIKDFNFTLWLW